MAATLTVEERKAGNGYLLRSGTGNLGTYATNGIAITARQAELGIIDYFGVANVGDYRLEWDKTNSKIKAYTDDGTSGISAEVGSVDMSAVVFRWQARGPY